MVHRLSEGSMGRHRLVVAQVGPSPCWRWASSMLDQPRLVHDPCVQVPRPAWDRGPLWIVHFVAAHSWVSGLEHYLTADVACCEDPMVIVLA